MPHPPSSDHPQLDDTPDALHARIAALERRLADLEGLRYAEALSRCLRILLTPVETSIAFQAALAETLEVVREAVGADRVTLAQHPPYAPGLERRERPLQVLTTVGRTGLSPLPPLSPEQLADIPPSLTVWQGGGGAYNGLVAGQFPEHPVFQRYSEAHRIQSVYLQPLMVGEHWWGYVEVIDHQQARSWDAGAVQLIRTAADMIVTFAESWKTTQALQEHETLLRSVNATLPSAFLFQLIQHHDGSPRQITYISPSVERLLAIRASNLAAGPYPLREMLHPDDRARFIIADQESQQSGTPFDIEVRIIKGDGQIGWFHFRAEIVRRIDLWRTQWNGIATEITSRKEAELALAVQLRYAEALARCSQILLVEGAVVPAWEQVVQQALATLRAALDCARLALWLFPDPDSAEQAAPVVVVAQGPAAPPGREPPLDAEESAPALRAAALRGELVAGTLDELFPEPSSLRAHFAANGLCSLVAAAVQIGGAWRGQLIAADAAESRRWPEPAMQLLRTGLEMITAFIHQRETTKALRAREAQLRAVGDNLPNGFIYQLRRDAGGRPSFTYLSSGVAQILGVPVAEGLRDAGAIYGTVIPEDQRRIAAVEHISATTMTDFEAIVRYNRPSGEQRWIYMRSRPRPGDDGSVIWDGITLDITERQKAAAELERARDVAESATRAKSAFLAAMSHEIRTPLNAVLGMAALLQDTELTADQSVCVDTIRTGGQALLDVISDILDLSRIESGHIEVQATPFDLPACLAAIVDLVAYGARQKGLSLRSLCDSSVPRVVVGDEARLRQVLLNLLSNAVKFTSQGEVALRAVATLQAERTALVTMTVRDTGIGMTPEQLVQIFEPFVQADHETSRRYGGTGLGLAISRQLVEAMGGRIEAASSPESGSSFSVSIPFPLADVVTFPRTPAPSPPQTGRPLRVLIAEDNPINQEVVKRMIVHLGHAVTVVADGQAAVAAVRQQVYDVVLMDVQMPVLDGEAAARQIRGLGAAIAQPRIIALTANALAGDRERFLRAGMDDYLSKPVQPTELQQALTRVVGAAEPPGA